MTAKVSRARKEAFLAALRATGNQTLAAERAKVSRSWVSLHRADDATFRQAIEQAVAAARARLGGHGERRPPPRWRYHDGEELVVKGTGGSGGGKRVQIARARLRQWSPRVEERFLAALTTTCNVTAACAEVGLTQASAYNHRRRWPAFAERWDEAVTTGYLQLEMGLIEAAGNLFSGEGLPEIGPIRAMTADHAIHMLHMHQHRVHRIGGRPGLRARAPDIETVRAEIVRKVEVMKRWKDSGCARAQARVRRPR